jgi:asparagine synthase (glutamine-hydrolysing)
VSGVCARFGIGRPDAVAAMAERIRHRGSVRQRIGGGRFEAEVLSGAAGGFVASGGGCTVLGDASLVALGSEPLTGASSGAAATQLLERYRQAGHRAFSEVNGDFAILVHDEAAQRVVAARDRAGSRPLYYAIDEGSWYFASEYKALLAVLSRKPAVDRPALAELQARKVVPLGRTLLEGIRQLPSGSLLIVSLAGQAKIERYWEPALELTDWPYERHCQELRGAFMRAVDRRMARGQATAISLSGGIDSIAIVATARHLHPHAELHTYSVGDSADDPELEWAARVARQFGAKHSAIVADPARLAADLPKLVWHLEDPIARTEVWQTLQLCEVMAPEARTILRGDGSDGMFGGMDRHQLLAWAAAAPLMRAALEDIYWFTQTGAPPASLLARLAVRHVLASRIPAVPRVLGGMRSESPEPLPQGGRELLNEVMVRGPIHALPMLLQKIERIVAAFGMTSLSPFVDPELMTVAFRIPSRFKHDGRRNKKVLRDAMRPLLPPELVNRPKYAQRVRESRAFCEALAAVAGRLLSPEQVRERGLFEPADVAQLLPRRQDGTWAPEHAMRVWTLVLTELWARAFVDGDGSTPPGLD